MRGPGAARALEHRLQTISGMQPRPRANLFIRHLVDAATVRPMLNLLLAMKQERVQLTPSAAPAPEQTAPLMHPRAA